MIKVGAFILFAAVAQSAIAQDTTKQPLSVVPNVDLNRYAGTWYEIARLPNRFQRTCVSDVTATYTLREDGNILVVNRCRNENGEMKQVEGLAKRASEDGPTSKLKVRFAPAILSFLPFVWGNYWIILLASDYTYAVVGEPNREYLWILSRMPSMDEAKFQEILEQVKQNGYELSTLSRTKNTAQ